MKKLKLFVLTLVLGLSSVSFVACSDDDDAANSSIVGSWLWSESNDYESEILTFTSDGTFIDQYTENGTTYTDTASYSYSGTVLTLTADGEVAKVSVIITGDTMIFDEDEIFIRM